MPYSGAGAGPSTSTKAEVVVVPRNWMCVKFGLNTAVIRDPHVLDDFIYFLRHELHENRIAVSCKRSPVLITSQQREAFERIKEFVNANSNRQLGKIPILFLISDDRTSIRNGIEERFSHGLYIFEATGYELQRMIQLNNFDEAREWCRTFAEIVEDYEGFRDFDENVIAILSDNVDRIRVGVTDSYSCRSLSQKINNDAKYASIKVEKSVTDCGSGNQPHNEERAMSNYGSRRSPKAEVNSDAISCYAESQSSARPTISQTLDQHVESHADDQHVGTVPSYSEYGCEVSYASECSSHSTLDPVDIGLIRKALENRVKSSSIAGRKLFHRFKLPFNDFTSNCYLLHLVADVCDPGDIANLPATRLILQEIISSRYVQKLCEVHGTEMVNDTSVHDAEKFFYFLRFIMDIFLLITRLFDYVQEADMGFSWNIYKKLLYELPVSFWNQVPVQFMEKLEEDCELIKNFFKRRQDGNDDEQGILPSSVTIKKENDDENETDFQQARPFTDPFEKPSSSRDLDVCEDQDSKTTQADTDSYSYQKCTSKVNWIEAVNCEQTTERRIEEHTPFFIDCRQNSPLWEKSENKLPPSSFRELSSLPRFSDVVRPEPSYLRRALERGAYNDENHYLDVQFRLFREDLVSPLRDGLYIHKTTGTSKYDRTYDLSCMVQSDLALFDAEEIGGLQVKMHTGEPMRSVKLSKVACTSPLLGRHLRFGQVVILSSDGFNNDVHIAIICDRNELDAGVNPFIYVSITDSPEGVDVILNKPYVIAEPTSYLEAYVHVLNALKDISPFAPIPMERYIVYAKNNLRRPLYMRVEDSPSDIAEDAAVIAHYEEIRILERARRSNLCSTPSQIVQESKKKKKKSASPSNEKNSNSDLDGYILPPKRNVADVTYLEQISVRGDLYSVKDMRSEFQDPDLDESQRRALVSALTNEMSLIQGPPGTGKTFIGVEIVRTICENRLRFGFCEPILIVCFTNAGLDQFLEKILAELKEDRYDARFDRHIGPLAVRLGTMCDNAAVLKENILRNDVVKEWKTQLAPQQEDALSRIVRQKQKCAGVLSTMAYIATMGKQMLLAFEPIQRVMSPEHVREFVQFANENTDSNDMALCNDEAMACWLLGRNCGYGKSTSMSMSNDSEPSDISGDESEDMLPTRRPNALPIELPDEDIEVLDDLLNRINLEAEQCAEPVDEDEHVYEKIWNLSSNSMAALRLLKLLNFQTKCVMNRSVFFSPKTQTSVDKNIVREIEDQTDNILKAKSLTEEEYKGIRTVFDLPKQRRWELYSYWRARLKKMMRSQLPNQMKEYKRTCDEVQNAMYIVDAEVMKRSLIIGATTTGAAKSREVLKMVGPKVLVVEEAAEVLEAHTLACFLPSLQHAIFIGDHQQLRPNPSVWELARDYHMDLSMFERLINNGIPFDTLARQHRMNSCISNTIVKPHFYPSVEDAENVLSYPDVGGIRSNLFFWTHEEPETSYDGISFTNPYEVEMVIALVKYLLQQGDYTESDITIIAVYSAQVDLIRRSVLQNFSLDDEGKPLLSVETVDSFQGRENKIVLVSLVRSMADSIGFLSVANRITVALTRAQHGMYLVGNLTHLASRSNLWRDIKASLFGADAAGFAFPISCKVHSTDQDLITPNEFASKSPCGGCSLPCTSKFPCGHDCERRCHPVDDHDRIVCTQQCLKTCANAKYNHPCLKQCNQNCGDCNEMVDVKLSCGHQTRAACHKTLKIEELSCPKSCELLLPCGHNCSELCGRPCTSSCTKIVQYKFLNCEHFFSVECGKLGQEILCSERCEEELPCGHRCANKCGDVSGCTFECQELVEKQMPCGHIVQVPCFKDVRDHKCQYLEEKVLKPCGHKVKIECWKGNSTKFCTRTCMELLDCQHTCIKHCGDCFVSGHRCSDICRKILSCGHLCVKRCGEPCSKPGECQMDCSTSCKHIRCGKFGSDAQSSFGRKCSQLCVLCSRACDNSCQHRSCSRRCYERCDVKPCLEPCKKQLPCGHACMGMCEEECPTICATCQKKRYLDIISVLGESDQPQTRVHRLIQLKCHHIFPVEYLDGIFTAQTADGNLKACPYCPTCETRIRDVKRYAKQLKTLTLNSYKEKAVLQCKIKSRESIRALAYQLREAMDKHNNNAKRDKRAPLRDRMAALLKTASDFMLDMDKKRRVESFPFCEDLFRCLWIMHELACETPGMVPWFGNLPNLRDVLVFTVLPDLKSRQKFDELLDDVCSFMNANVTCELSGILVPRAKRILVNMVVIRTFEKCSVLLSSPPCDITEQEKSKLLLAVRNLLCESDTAEYMGHFANEVNSTLFVHGSQPLKNFFEKFVWPEF